MSHTHTRAGMCRTVYQWLYRRLWFEATRPINANPNYRCCVDGDHRLSGSGVLGFVCSFWHILDDGPGRRRDSQLSLSRIARPTLKRESGEMSLSPSVGLTCRLGGRQMVSCGCTASCVSGPCVSEEISGGETVPRCRSRRAHTPRTEAVRVQRAPTSSAGM